MLRLLPGLVYTADAMTRADMARGEFFDERTYVATLLSRSRDLWRLAGGSCAFIARTPHQTFEQANGVDAVIGFRAGKHYKMIGLEFKRPLFGGAPIVWDKIVPAAMMSRFCRQIFHQKNLEVAGWFTGAFFIDERSHAVGSAPFDDLGGFYLPRSVLEPIAQAKIAPPVPKVWITADVLPLMANANNLNHLITETIACRLGQRMSQAQALKSAMNFRASLNAERDAEIVPHVRFGIDRDERDMFPEDPQLDDQAFLAKLAKLTGARSLALFVIEQFGDQ